MYNKIEIVQKFINIGVIHPDVSNNTELLLEMAMTKIRANILICNVPETATTIDGEIVEVDSHSMYETLQQFGNVEWTSQITPFCFVAFSKDAEEIIKYMDGNMIGKNKMSVYYYSNIPTKQLLVVESRKSEDDTPKLLKYPLLHNHIINTPIKNINIPIKPRNVITDSMIDNIYRVSLKNLLTLCVGVVSLASVYMLM